MIWRKNRIQGERGKAYFGRTKREGKYCYDIERTPREFKRRCICKGSNRSSIKLAVLSEEDSKTMLLKNAKWEGDGVKSIPVS